ncbi:MAG: L-2-amino-thiazoline-4-carboxylic acid hydrolase [Acidobacteriota bacterium]
MILRTVGGWSSSRKERSKVRRFARTFRGRGDALVEWYGEQEAAVMHEEMLDEFRRLIPEIPYIGGRRNPYSGMLVGAAKGLAMYRVIVRHGGSLEETGELMHRRNRARLWRIPRVIRHGLVRNLFLRQQEKAVRRSQARRYPGDWVLEVVESDGETFDYGMDVTECGDLKFLKTQGAEELCPYICDLDYLMFEAMGVGLHRTRTLAWGCDRCDFRISLDGATSATWPPEFVERTCGQPQT